MRPLVRPPESPSEIIISPSTLRNGVPRGSIDASTQITRCPTWNVTMRTPHQSRNAIPTLTAGKFRNCDYGGFCGNIVAVYADFCVRNAVQLCLDVSLVLLGKIHHGNCYSFAATSCACLFGPQIRT